MMHQRSVWYGCPFPHAGRDQAAIWYEKAERARREQSFEYAVAPRVRLLLPSGRILLEGEQVHEEDFVGGGRPSVSLFREALRAGRVLARADGEPSLS